MSKVSSFTRRSVLTLVASAALYSGACSSDDDPVKPAGETPNEDLEGVVYLGGANDEGLEVLLDASVKPSPAPVITSPEAGEVLEGPLTFGYHAGETAALDAPAPRSETGSARGRFVTTLAELLGAERSAHAHGAPMNGEGYLLTFGSADEPELLRVFTDQTTYLPNAEEWQTLVDASGELTLTVTLGVFDEGRLAPGGGPFESAPLAFSIVVP